MEAVTNQARIEFVETDILTLLDHALETNLNMVEDEDAYDIPYISKKLAQVGVFQERLSDIMMKLTKYSIEITRQSSNSKSLLDLAEQTYRDSDTYKHLPRDEKTNWLQSQLNKDRELNERWAVLKRIVSEVKDAVTERAQTMKRLDSDLRLHSKLYESKGHTKATGGSSPTAYTGNAQGDMSID